MGEGGGQTEPGKMYVRIEVLEMRVLQLEYVAMRELGRETEFL